MQLHTDTVYGWVCTPLEDGRYTAVQGQACPDAMPPGMWEAASGAKGGSTNSVLGATASPEIKAYRPIKGEGLSTRELMKPLGAFARCTLAVGPHLQGLSPCIEV
mmetsp:Transcript_37677/g.67240  ORF Transcript_37677/g.67240 Transcript_37677/m.67240 type:complete len:105 (-) Transcript_37677:105-419(-)